MEYVYEASYDDDTGKWTGDKVPMTLEHSRRIAQRRATGPAYITTTINGERYHLV